MAPAPVRGSSEAETHVGRADHLAVDFSDLVDEDPAPAVPEVAPANDVEAPTPAAQRPPRQPGYSIWKRKLTRAEAAAGVELQHPEDVLRPVTRGDCDADPGRPCPWVSCKHHLYLDVNPETGSLKLNFPHLEVWEMAETCSLDVAARGPQTLIEVGALVNITRQRVQQIETQALQQGRLVVGEDGR